MTWTNGVVPAVVEPNAVLIVAVAPARVNEAAALDREVVSKFPPGP